MNNVNKSSKDWTFLLSGIILLSGLPALALLGACSEQPIPRVSRTVVAVGDCTEGTGGWGGMQGRCRVTYNTGERGTVMRPVGVGDIVECRESNKSSEWSCRIL